MISVNIKIDKAIQSATVEVNNGNWWLASDQIGIADLTVSQVRRIDRLVFQFMFGGVR